ncbi:MAG: hypothetical protein AAF212_01350 [Verrucomicrobiota bacterium]
MNNKIVALFFLLFSQIYASSTREMYEEYNRKLDEYDNSTFADSKIISSRLLEIFETLQSVDPGLSETAANGVLFDLLFRKYIEAIYEGRNKDGDRIFERMEVAFSKGFKINIDNKSRPVKELILSRFFFQQNVRLPEWFYGESHAINP